MKRLVFPLVAVLMTGILPSLGVEPRPSEGDPIPKQVSTDPTYGVSEKNPIQVGRKHGGSIDEEMFLDAIRGPKGEKVRYKRLGSCCGFETPNAWVGGKALLDKYEVKYAGLEKPIILFLDMYDYAEPSAPMGFTVKK